MFSVCSKSLYIGLECIGEASGAADNPQKQIIRMCSNKFATRLDYECCYWICYCPQEYKTPCKFMFPSESLDLQSWSWLVVCQGAWEQTFRNIFQ